MPDYQISARSEREIRVGQEGQAIGHFQRGRFIQDMRGEIGRDAFEMKLPAPWRGMRYRLLQDGRELANAGRPTGKRGMVRFEVEMPGRRLELASEDPHGLVYVLSEAGAEVARYAQHSFDARDEWTGGFQGREATPALAAFVAWIVREARGFHRR